MHKRTLIVLVAALLSAALSCAAFAQDTKATESKKFDQKEVLMEFWKAPDDTVVGIVNGEKVTKRDVLKQLWFWNAPAALQDILNQKMIEQGAAKAGIEMTWADKEQQIKQALDRSGSSDLDQLLNMYRITYYRFMTATKLSGLMEKLVQKQIQVTDDDYGEWIKARHILIRFPQDEKDKTKQEEIAKKRADEIYARIKAGEDFAKLADEFSEDPGNERDGVKQGGDLGWFTRGRMVQEFEKVAFELQPGEVSEPVKTLYGFHIIKVEKNGRDATDLEKAELKKMILERKTPMEMQKVYGELQAKTKMENKLMPPAPPAPQPVAGPKPAPAPTPRSNASQPEPPQPTAAPKPAAPPPDAKPEDVPPPPPPPAP